MLRKVLNSYNRYSCLSILDIKCKYRKKGYTLSNMLILSKDLINKKVLSLRTNSPIASVVDYIVNPNNLTVVGFYCQDRFDKKTHLVLINPGY